MTNLNLVNGENLVATEDYHIIERGKFKIGVIGLAEPDWVATLAAFDEEDIVYEDMVQSANKWSRKLREEHGCNFIIALTHLRIENDIKVAKESKGVDLFLGGHDHVI